MKDLPELGVGIVCLPGLEPLVEAGRGIIDVIEIEPQPFWFKTDTYHIDTRALERIASFAQHKIIHGVGFPIGGTVAPDPEQVALYIDMIVALKAPWASEHLSFAKVDGPLGPFNAGFLLPPLQSTQTVAVAAANIGDLSARLPVPFAFETGVNYLRPMPGEMSDGAFFRAVAEASDCGILLDLHNLWCNQLNGRQAVLDALSEMPLERVWEVHLAGGDNLNGYWLDAHSGLVPPDLMRLARDILPHLPNLKALIFEIVPDYLPAKRLDHSHLLSQLKEMRTLWQARRRKNRITLARKALAPATNSLPSPSEWESALAALVHGNLPKKRFAFDLEGDQGVDVLRTLVGVVRTGTVAELLMLTYRLIVLSLGEPTFLDLLREFWKTAPPELFPTDESLQFAKYLRAQPLGIPHLDEILAFELATHQVLMQGQPETVRFTCAPVPLLTALREGRLPDFTDSGEYELTVTP